MDASQRKVHRIIWMSVAIVVPLFILFSIKDLHFKTAEKKSSPVETASEELVLKTAENEFIKTILYEDHVEIILKSPLKNASSIVYTADTTGKPLKIIGQITASGIYNFDIQSAPEGIALYDGIRKTEITKILF